MVDKRYVFAASRPWHLAAFQRTRGDLPGQWSVVAAEADLAHTIESVEPRYVFFPHWSHIVPRDLIERYECVCFHMTDLPYGRGGSPLQNLIARGHAETRITALRMAAEVDAGPIYFKRPLSLEGSASEIFARVAALSMSMLHDIVRREPVPEPQFGEPVVFRRRTPDQSVVPEDADARKLYDHIRMLDAEGYPHAFLDHGRWRALFTGARLEADDVVAEVRFTRKPEEQTR